MWCVWESGESEGVDELGVLYSGCIGGALPFLGIAAEGDYRGALREYREGLGSRAGEFDRVPTQF